MLHVLCLLCLTDTILWVYHLMQGLLASRLSDALHCACSGHADFARDAEER